MNICAYLYICIGADSATKKSRNSKSFVKVGHPHAEIVIKPK